MQLFQMRSNNQRRAGKALLSALLALCLLIDPVPTANAAESGAALLKTMTTEEKVSQMLMPAFRWWKDAEGKTKNLTEINDEVSAILSRHGFAGVVLFTQNAAENEATATLIDAMQTANAKGANRTQLLVAVDQEGGGVTRLGQGTAFPGNMALGAANDLTATAAAARTIGEELGALGFNFDFAPVVDVNSNPANPVIGTRSFSDDAQTVAKQGAAFMTALMETGAISALKHFPGHGDTNTDSHTGLPRIDKTYDALKANELIPFQACVDAGAEAIMTAHIQYPAIEKETYVSRDSGEAIPLPATLSRTILTDILRGDMGFDGLILTDAMDMDAIAKNFDPMDAARLAINAGVDILLMPVDPGSMTDAEGLARLDQYIADLAVLVDGDAKLSARVNESVSRILALKEKHGLLDAYSGMKPFTSVGSAEHHATEWEIAKKAVTLVKNDGDLFPLTAKNQKIAVLTAYDNEVLSMEYAVARLKDERKLPDGTEVTVTSIQKKTLEECLPLIDGMDHVIAVSEAGSLAAMNPNTNAYSALLDALRERVHSSGGTFTVLSASLPYDAARYTGADAFVITWNARGMNEDPRVTDGAVKQYGASMPAALYQMFLPDAVFTGTLPINIPAMDAEYRYTDTILYPRGFGLAGKHEDTVCPKDATCPISAFTDTDAKAWYHDGVHWALENGVMQGAGSKQFAPDGGTSRAMAVTMLWRLEGSPSYVGMSGYADVSNEDWFGPAVRWASAEGVVTGYGGGRFGPNDAVTREQLAAMLYRYAQYKKADVSASASLSNYGDAQAVSGWATSAMQWAVGSGIINGMDGNLVPAGNATRAQVATMLMRYSTAK